MKAEKNSLFGNGKELEQIEDCKYECRCDCGNTIIVKASDLQSGKVWACEACMITEKKN